MLAKTTAKAEGAVKAGATNSSPATTTSRAKTMKTALGKANQIRKPDRRMPEMFLAHAQNKIPTEQELHEKAVQTLIEEMKEESTKWRTAAYVATGIAIVEASVILTLMQHG